MTSSLVWRVDDVCLTFANPYIRMPRWCSWGVTSSLFWPADEDIRFDIQCNMVCGYVVLVNAECVQYLYYYIIIIIDL